MTPYDKNRMRFLYENGDALAEIAFQVGCAEGSVSTLCRRMGCPPRAMGRPLNSSRIARQRTFANDNGVGE